MKSFAEFLAESSSDQVNEVVSTSEKNRLVIKSGSSSLYIEKSASGISIGVKDGQDNAMIDVRGNDVKSIKDFLA